MPVFINGVPFGAESFPNSEGIYKSCDIHNADTVIVKMVFEDDRDITRVIMAKGMIDEYAPKNAKSVLFMPYIPYSRMDRKIKGFCFTLKYFCRLINSLDFDEVRVYDPHSNVSVALLDRVKELPLLPQIEKIIAVEKPDYIFYPDNGAVKKYTEILDIALPVFFGNKKRNLETGKIIKYELVNTPECLDGKTILIIDDICVGGRTFLEAAQAIKAAGGGKVILYVTHMEKAIEGGQLLGSDEVDKIYTLDTMENRIENEKIRILTEE